MRTGRPKVALILTDEERQRLESLAHRSRSAPHVARPARIILTCAEGTDSKVVAFLRSKQASLPFQPERMCGHRCKRPRVRGVAGVEVVQDGWKEESAA